MVRNHLGGFVKTFKVQAKDGVISIHEASRLSRVSLKEKHTCCHGNIASDALFRKQVQEGAVPSRGLDFVEQTGQINNGRRAAASGNVKHHLIAPKGVRLLLSTLKKEIIMGDYVPLKNVDGFIPLEECEHRAVYRIRSRNLSVTVFDKDQRGFTGVREKFGDKFLFTEYHWDTGPPFGTAKPVEKIDVLPDDMSIEESLGTIDLNTDKPVVYERDQKGWRFEDEEEISKEIRPCGVPNKELFKFLEDKESNETD